MNKDIRMIVFDIDGVLTDGKVYIDSLQNDIKTICYKDLDFMNLLKKAGIKLVAITGESGGIVDVYKEKFPWDMFFDGCKQKADKLRELAGQTGLSFEQICYVGDGYYDIEAMKTAGLGMCPNNAIAKIKETADIVLRSDGGMGCVEEIYNILFTAGQNDEIRNGAKGTDSDIIEEVKELTDRYPVLDGIKADICKAFSIMAGCFFANNKVMIAGNGGSAADSEHMVGELMKSFRIHRHIDSELAKRIMAVDAVKGEKLCERLQSPLEAMSLVCHEGLSTAFMNDVDGSLTVAQQLLGYGKKNDVFIAISTSGNSENIVNAAILARAMDIRVIALTGASGGKLKDYADCCVAVPETETYKVQELHLPIYHWWCRCLEVHFFGQYQ